MLVTGADNVDRDEDDYDINDGVFIHTVHDVSSENQDPFAKDYEFAKSLSGVTPNKKRSITAFAKRREAEILEKRHEGHEGTRSKKIEDDIITGYNAFEVVLPPYNQDYLAKLYELSTPHKAAVDAKMSNIVSLGYDFIPSPQTQRKMDDLEEEKAEKFQKKLSRAKQEMHEYLDGLNEDDTFTEIMQKVWKDYETTGNGYLEIGRTVTGRITYLGHVPSPTVRIRRQRDGFVQIIANKAVFFRNFGKDDVDPIGGDPNPNEIIHIKKYAPSSTFYGVPDIVAAKQAVAGNKFSQDFNLDYFENKAVPRHVVILKGATINPRLAKNILEFFETGLKGKNHRSLFIPLPSGDKDHPVELKIESVEAGVQEGSFAKYRGDNRDEILMAHRVPITKVGTPSGVNLAVARDADKTFKEQVCSPEQDILEKKLNRIIRDIQADIWLFVLKLNELTLTDENTQSQIDERRIKTGQRMPNELRVRDGLPEHPDGNKLVNVNAVAEAAEAKAKTDAKAVRERDSVRSASATDSVGEGRNPKGEGRTNADEVA
jgi:PBSX family phage portal protein